MKIQLLSDLHLELRRPVAEFGDGFYDYDFPVAAEYLALLGDVGCTVQDGMFDWLRTRLPRFERIFFVAGNHEPYGSNIDQSHARLHAFEVESNGKFVFLNQTRFDISPELTILGCTLWAALDPDKLDIIGQTLQDFKRIDDYTPAEYLSAHRADVAWLNDTVAHIASAEPQRKIIVFTHHAPTVDGTSDSKFAGQERPTKSAFASELTGEMCWTAGNVVLWAHGHTHWCCDFVRKGVRVVSNQRGSREGSDAYDPATVIDVAE